MHTKKFHLCNFYGKDFDATIHTSGGELHTVTVENIDDGSRRWKSFSGKDARQRAEAYAMKETGIDGKKKAE